MLPSTRERVPAHTSRADNAAIERRLSESLEYYAQNLSQIDERLRELDREWDIERAIELNASALAFAGVLAGTFRDRRWLMLPAAVTSPTIEELADHLSAGDLVVDGGNSPFTEDGPRARRRSTCDLVPRRRSCLAPRGLSRVKAPGTALVARARHASMCVHRLAD